MKIPPQNGQYIGFNTGSGRKIGTVINAHYYSEENEIIYRVSHNKQMYYLSLWELFPLTDLEKVKLL